MTLSEKLEAALVSRERRKIRRRLPSPTRSTSARPTSDMPEKALVDFVSNDYLSLTSYAPLRELFLKKLRDAPDVLGSGGSRLLVNGTAHQALEERLAKFFSSPAALLFNSGFDANVGIFTCIPQEGDVVVYDENIHASVHDGIRSSRARSSSFPFKHNSARALRQLFLELLQERPSLKSGLSNVFVAVETLYSMDGTFAPLREIVELLDTLFPCGNGYLIVDEAHATGLYGPKGRGLVSHWGIEDKVLVRLHTFGKALASSGAVVLTNQLIKDYLLNYARSLIYTTSLSCASVISADCSFDILEDGTATKLAKNLENLILYTLDLLQKRLAPFPPDVVSLPNHLKGPPSELVPPIIPVMTSTPRPLSAYLRELDLNARPISWPTVPKGRDRVRVCLHAGNSEDDVERLVNGIVRWADDELTRRGLSRRDERKVFNVLVEAKL